MKKIYLFLTLLISLNCFANEQKNYSFLITPQYGITEDAIYWSFILSWITKQSGVKIYPVFTKNYEKTLIEINSNLHDFIVADEDYNLTSKYEKILEYKNKNRKNNIIVNQSSDIKSLNDLNKKTIVQQSKPNKADQILYEILNLNNIEYRAINCNFLNCNIFQLMMENADAAITDLDITSFIYKNNNKKFRVLYEG